MQVKDVMTTTPATVQSHASIWEAIQLMLARSVSGLPVVDAAGSLVGVLSEGDLLRRVELGTTRHEEGWFRSLFHPSGLADGYKAAHARTVADVMSLTPVTIEPTAPLEQAVTLMEGHSIKRLPVVEKGVVVGILSRSDFLRALAPMLAPTYEEQATSDAEIERTIVDELRRQEWASGTAITPKAQDGKVTLLGAVLSEAQRGAARVLAENVNGVRSVIDELVWADPTIRFGV